MGFSADGGSEYNACHFPQPVLLNNSKETSTLLRRRGLKTRDQGNGGRGERKMWLSELFCELITCGQKWIPWRSWSSAVVRMVAGFWKAVSGPEAQLIDRDMRIL